MPRRSVARALASDWMESIHWWRRMERIHVLLRGTMGRDLTGARGFSRSCLTALDPNQMESSHLARRPSRTRPSSCQR